MVGFGVGWKAKVVVVFSLVGSQDAFHRVPPEPAIGCVAQGCE